MKSKQNALGDGDDSDSDDGNAQATANAEISLAPRDYEPDYWYPSGRWARRCGQVARNLETRNVDGLLRGGNTA